MTQRYVVGLSLLRGLPMQAMSRGTHIDSVVPPWMVKRLVSFDVPARLG